MATTSEDLRSIVLVVSPVTSLMKDQVQQRAPSRCKLMLALALRGRFSIFDPSKVPERTAKQICWVQVGMRQFVRGWGGGRGGVCVWTEEAYGYALTVNMPIVLLGHFHVLKLLLPWYVGSICGID